MLFPETINDRQYKALVNGEIKDVSIHDFRGKYVVLVFYPFDFTFVCPTEVNRFSDLHDEFVKRDACVLLISCDSVYSHMKWASISRDNGGIAGTTWPMISDIGRDLSKEFNLFDDANQCSMRGTVILGKALDVKHISANILAVGRSAIEILRLVDAIKFNDENGEVCPVEWNAED